MYENSIAMAILKSIIYHVDWHKNWFSFANKKYFTKTNPPDKIHSNVFWFSTIKQFLPLFCHSWPRYFSVCFCTFKESHLFSNNFSYVKKKWHWLFETILLIFDSIEEKCTAHMYDTYTDSKNNFCDSCVLFYYYP